MAHYQSDRYVKLIFQEIPEISEAHLPAFLAERTLPRPASEVSFGARVIRSAGATAIDLCDEWIEEQIGRVAYAQPFDDHFTKLHQDSDKNSGLTAHHTIAGSIKFILLLQSNDLVSTLPHLVFSIPKSKKLFTKGVLDTSWCAEPTIAYKSVLSEGDLVIFDHSQPHAILTVSKQRQSVAHY